jgi:hypothetical protein
MNTSSLGEERFDKFQENAEDLLESLDYISELADVATKERLERMVHFEKRVRSLIGLLERVVTRAGIRISADDAAAMDRLESLENKVGKLGEKVEAVCKYLGIAFDKQDEIRRPPLLIDDEYAKVEWMFPVTTRRTADTTSAFNVADLPATLTTPPLPACGPPEALVPQIPAGNADAGMSSGADNGPAPPERADTVPTASHNPADIPEPAAQPAAEPETAAASQPDPIAATSSDLPPIPGVNLIEPTPENSQETAATHSTLIPPGTINAAGMRTRSQSRGNTPAPPSPAVLPLPDPVDPAVAGQSSGGSRGSSRSPRPPKRNLIAEESTSKRQRQG